jgi:hypothetical protein
LGFPPRRPGFDLRSSHVGLVVGKVALGKVSSFEYFGFLWQFSFYGLLRTHHHLSSGADTVGQIVAHVPRGLSFTPPLEIKKSLIKLF